ILKINQLIQGWGNYFKVGDIKSYAENIDKHIRRRLRACLWKQWKKIKTKYKNLRKLGISRENARKSANTRKGYWRNSRNPVINAALSNKYWRQLGLKSLQVIIS
ncbi:group II intron maturase-specific domain-containing protein, partial [Bacillus sp. MMSF_3328]|uniref:group II intron maturase-specific domain-containing protein n=1 Tax=Bacillus sp. MMSF_3328 TaxID=3047080 RepID=UPI00273E0F8F